MGNADKKLEMILNTTDEKYDESIRQYQGCPSLAITKGGRIYASWCSGGNKEPHIDNYDLVVYSDDLGKTWSKPLLVFPSSKISMTQVLDSQVWVSPEGKLFVFISRDDVLKDQDGAQGYTHIDGYIFVRERICAWMCVCDNPDAEEPTFSAPVCWSTGIMRTKPLIMSNGEWLIFNSDPLLDRYSYTISSDAGKTFTRYYGCEKKYPVDWAEPMAYEMKDGTIHMYARSLAGKLSQSFSTDFGRTWCESTLSNIVSAHTRFYISRTSTGRLLLVHNDCPDRRCRMTVCLSEDDGKTWKYKKCIDPRNDISYPDVDYYEGKFYLIYDRERSGIGAAREILFAEFTEEDIMNADTEIEVRVISKPSCEV